MRRAYRKVREKHTHHMNSLGNTIVSHYFKICRYVGLIEKQNKGSGIIAIQVINHCCNEIQPQGEAHDRKFKRQEEGD